MSPLEFFVVWSTITFVKILSIRPADIDKSEQNLIQYEQ